MDWSLANLLIISVAWFAAISNAVEQAPLLIQACISALLQIYPWHISVKHFFLSFLPSFFFVLSLPSFLSFRGEFDLSL
jgi:anaerobic C4-dicarboxylate transporter